MNFINLSERTVKNLLFRLDDERGFTNWKLSCDIDDWYALLTDLTDIITDTLEVAYDEGVEDGVINWNDVEVPDTAGVQV